MPRTAPAPNAPVLPGMNGGPAVKAGKGGGGGGAGKKAKKGKGKKKAPTKKGKKQAKGGKKGAAKGKNKKGGKTKGDPVCPVTGAVLIQYLDFAFAGPAPLRWERSYDSKASDVASELGWGWSHSFGWTAVIERRGATVFEGGAAAHGFPELPASDEYVQSELGWLLCREGTGLLLRIPDEGGKRFHFGPAVRGRHLLTAVADRNGNRIELQRDAEGRLHGLIDSAGRAYRIDGDGQRIRGVYVATDAARTQWMQVAGYEYSAEGDLVRVVDAEEHASNYSYSNHLLVRHSDAEGLTAFYRYDGETSEAYCVETWCEYPGRADLALAEPISPVLPDLPDNRTRKGLFHTRFTYVKDEYFTEVETALGGVERIFGDEFGRVLKEVDAAGGVEETFFDEMSGNVAEVSYPDGSVHRIDYDDEGTPVGAAGEGGRSIVFTEDDGTEVHFDEASQAVVLRRYDRCGNETFVRHADHSFEETEFEARGLPVRRVSRSGEQTFFRWDDQGNCIAMEWADGRVVRQEFDFLGRRILHVDENGLRTEWGWDRRNEVVWKRDADGSTIHIERNGHGKPVKVDEGQGRVWRIEYGGESWITRTTGPSGETTEYRYDLEGNVVWVKNPRGQVFQQTFDVAGRPIGCRTFEGVEFEGGFDVAGRRSWIGTPNGRRLLTNDTLDRIINIERPDGRVVAIEYGASGPTRVDNGIVLETQYDRDGKPIHTRQQDHEVAVTWAGGVVETARADAGVALRYGRRNGRLATLNAGERTVRFQSLPNGESLAVFDESLVLRQRRGPNGFMEYQVLARLLDRSLPLEALATTADPNVVFWSSYEYDRNQNLVREQHSDGVTVQYDVDLSNRITARRLFNAGVQIDEERLAYDLAGTPRMADVQYDDLVRPASVGEESFEYDLQGRLAVRHTAAGDWTYEWADEDDLVRVQRPDAIVEMDYDGFGRRIRKRVLRDGELITARSYVWAGTGDILLCEVDDLRGTCRTYLREDEQWCPFGHVDLIDGVEIPTWYLTSPIGSPMRAYDSRGNVVWRAETQSIYGAVNVADEQVSISARFANQDWDPDVELTYNRFRWYDPRVGQYVTADPLFLEGTANPRDYAPNPLKWIDPLGLTPTPTPGTTFPANSAVDPDLQKLVVPGPNAQPGNGSPPGFAVATGKAKTTTAFTAAQKATVQAAGNAHGCHSCGRTKAQYKKDTGKSFKTWRRDHQPPKSLISKNTPGEMRLYPHCPGCSNKQGGLVGGASAASIKELKASAKAQMAAR